MKGYCFFLVLGLLSCKSEVVPDDADKQDSSLKSKEITRLDGSTIEASLLKEKINYLISQANVTGLAVSIFNNSEVVFSNAFGYAHVDKRTPLSTDHVFYGASFSKAVFGVLVSQLAAEGHIDLDKPLQEYLDRPLPEYEFEKEWRGYSALKGDKRYELITARMCLSHMAGFPNWRWLTKDFDFDREGQIRFVIDPGTRYSYSGEGFSLLQFVLEKIMGKGLEEMARERIFDPLGMDMTSYVWQERFEEKYCNGHTVDQEVIKKDIEDEAGAAGSMETTITDYAKLFTYIFKSYAEDSELIKTLFTENVRIKSKFQFGAASWEDTDENDDIRLSYGLGWGILHSPHGIGAFKEGHGEGFQHYSILFPETGIGVILMSNSDNAESIFKELLEVTIGDIYTPWKWERYIPYNL